MTKSVVNNRSIVIYYLLSTYLPSRIGFSNNFPKLFFIWLHSPRHILGIDAAAMAGDLTQKKLYRIFGLDRRWFSLTKQKGLVNFSSIKICLAISVIDFQYWWIYCLLLCCMYAHCYFICIVTHEKFSWL